MLNRPDRLSVLERLGRAISDPSRARILLRLLEGPTYPSVLADVLGLGRANVSNHLTCLRACGLVVAEPEGRRSRYSISDPHLTRALESLLEVVLAVEDGTACPGEGCELGCCCLPQVVETGEGAR